MMSFSTNRLEGANLFIKNIQNWIVLQDHKHEKRLAQAPFANSQDEQVVSQLL